MIAEIKDLGEVKYKIEKISRKQDKKARDTKQEGKRRKLYNGLERPTLTIEELQKTTTIIIQEKIVLKKNIKINFTAQKDMSFFPFLH